jgi:hypothetical protein
MMSSSSGVPRMGNKDFGSCSVRGLSLVPKPAQRMRAFIAKIQGSRV